MNGIELMKHAWREFSSLQRHYCGPEVSKVYEIAFGVVLIVASNNTFWYYFSSDVARFKNLNTARYWGTTRHREGRVFAFVVKMHNPTMVKLIAEARIRITSLQGKEIQWFKQPHQFV